MVAVYQMLYYKVINQAVAVIFPPLNSIQPTCTIFSPSSGILSILTLILLSGCYGSGTLTCEEQSMFQCANGNCLAQINVNNSVNDCGDNSDEVWEPCRPPMFTCSMGEGHCTMMDFVLDGRMDCKDASDEAKIIGTDCTMIQDCCYCDDYVKNSLCLSGVCQCQSGHYTNSVGTLCTRRIVGDKCNNDSDCYDAFNSSACITGSCKCNVGYYPSDDLTSCIVRVVGDACATDEDCISVIDNSNCTRGHCLCKSGYYQSIAMDVCIRRRIQENCTLQTDCADVIPNSACANSTCVCLGDNIPSPDGYLCRLRQVGDSCDVEEHCKYIKPIGFCRKGSCDCQYGFHTPYDPYVCQLRRLADSCKENIDCFSAVDKSVCRNLACDCQTDYVRHPNRTVCMWAHRPEEILAISLCVFLIGVLCFVIIALLPVILYYFVWKPNTRKYFPPKYFTL